MAICIKACGDNLILRTEEKNSYHPVHLLTFLDLHMRLLDFSLQRVDKTGMAFFSSCVLERVYCLFKTLT